MALTINHNANSLASSSQVLTIDNTGSLVLAKGTTAQRNGAPVVGSVRYNTDTGRIEVFDNSLSWQSIVPGSGGGGSDDAFVFALIFGS